MEPDVDDQDDQEDEADEAETPLAPWQFTLRGMLGLTTVVAILCALIAWWGVVVVAAIVGASAGAFLAALACPLFTGDYVLSHLPYDVPRALAVGGYLVGGLWIIIRGLQWLLSAAGAPHEHLALPGGILLAFLASVGGVVWMLWEEATALESVAITVGAVSGAGMMVALTG
jgi:hypothetical protein